MLFQEGSHQKKRPLTQIGHYERIIKEQKQKSIRPNVWILNNLFYRFLCKFAVALLAESVDRKVEEVFPQ